MTFVLRRLLAGIAPALLLAAWPVAALAADSEGSIDFVESRDGEVRVLFSVPGLTEGVSPDPSTVTVTVNGDPVEAEASTVEGSDAAVRRTAVMAIDVSRSMQGAAFDAAKQAALAYLDNAPDDLYVGLVTFASEVETVVEPTQDMGSLTSAVESLELTLETRLYDGVLQALDVTGDDGQRSVLLLSDGRDTGTTELDEVLSAADDSEVRVDAVALNQQIDAESPLSQIAAATGGSITETSDLAELEALFAEEADVLSKQLLVTFAVPAGLPSSDASLAVSVQADADTFSDQAFVSLASATSGPPAEPTYSAPPDEGGLSLDSRWLIAGVGLLFVGFAGVLGFGMSQSARAEMTPLQQQLHLYTAQGLKRKDAKPAADSSAPLKDSALALAEKLMQKRDFEEALSTKLDRAGLKLKASEWLLLHVGIAIAAGIVGIVLSGGNIIVTILLLVLGLVLPWLFLSFKESRRIKAFNSQLAQTLQIIAGALQAGLSLPQAVDTVVQEGSEPVAGEFRRAIIEQRLGVEIEDTLDTVADRMSSLDFKWVVMAVRIQREVGGNLSELLLTVAATLREREYLRRQVQVLSAEGRLSAWILGGLPPFFLAYLALARPDYLRPMIENPMGWIMIGFACVLMAVGTFWLKKAVKVEV